MNCFSTYGPDRRIGVLFASLLLATLSLMTLIQYDSENIFWQKTKLRESRHVHQMNISDDHQMSLLARDEKNKKKVHSTTYVHLVVVACEGKSDGKPAIKEAQNMIKSAILLSIDSKIKVTIFTNEGNEDRVRSSFLTWPLLAQARIDLHVATVRYPLPPEEINEFRDWWGPCASFRLFLPEVLADTDSVLYVDSDVLFLAPPQEIWRHFIEFNEHQVGGLAPRVGWDFKVPPSNPNFIMTPSGKLTQVNSGVFLMNLTRMREHRFVTSEAISLNGTFKWDKDLLLPLYYRNKNDMFGDQNLINTAFHYNPEAIFYLSCRWNYHHKFCFDARSERSCLEADELGAAIAHGNAKTFYNNYSPVFKAINDVFTQYKWQNDLVKHLYKKIAVRIKKPFVDPHEHCGGQAETFLISLRKFVQAYPTLDRII